MISGNAIWWIDSLHMASMLSSRFLFSACSLYCRFPKASDTRRYASKYKVSASALLKNLRSPASEQAELKVEKRPVEEAQSDVTGLKDDFQFGIEQGKRSRPKSSRNKLTEQANGYRSRRTSSLVQDLQGSRPKTDELKTILDSLKGPATKAPTKAKPKEQKEPSEGTAKEPTEPSTALLRPKWLQNDEKQDTVSLKYNKILRDLQEKSSEESLPSGNSSELLDDLRNSVDGSERDDVRSILQKSIEAAREGRKRKTVGEGLMSSTTKSLPQNPERKWVERNLEDLEKDLSQTEPSQTKANPELNQKIKDIISELKVAPKQLGTAKTIVTAVENWGKRAFNQSQDIMDEYKEQTNELAFSQSDISLEEGDRLGLFDNILHDVKTKNFKATDESTFLMQSDYLEEVDNVGQIGVWQNTFRDEISLSNKLWQYPIDNEVCKVEEQGVSFEEHVFLEYLLDEFPNKGPVRRFMELVINGLQQNPHLTVEQKKERVRWFSDYFSKFSEEELNF